MRRLVLTYMLVTAASGLFFSACQQPAASSTSEVLLFNGKDFTGWEGDTIKIWKVEENAIAGGSLTETVPENDFLVTTKSYSDFKLKLEFKLLGSEGFINSGVQFRSQRVQDPPNEMVGYQADLGDGYWASIYDEMRRNKTLTPIDSSFIESILKRNEWNDYEIHAEGNRIRLYLNNKLTADYTEEDSTVARFGLIGLQIHGGGKAKVLFRNMKITELNQQH